MASRPLSRDCGSDGRSANGIAQLMSVGRGARVGDLIEVFGALEDNNCTIYHVVNGSRVGFQNKNIKVPTNVWHTLKVEATGDHFVVTYDGTKVLDAKDQTFKDAGKVGLWTKADSVMAFDDFTISGK
jgi:hypothetical protein